MNPDGGTPAACWDFSERYHILTNHSKITKEAVILWGDHGMRWGVNDSPIPKITYERQDQDRILSLAQNSSTVGLNEKVEHTFNKLDGHQ